MKRTFRGMGAALSRREFVRLGGAGLAGAVLLGVGTAMVYPTLLAAIGDVAHPSWRASAVGVYRLWRDLGYAIGALLAGLIADAFGLQAALWFVGALTFVSGAVSALRMKETLPVQTRTLATDSHTPTVLASQFVGAGGQPSRTREKTSAEER